MDIRDFICIHYEIYIYIYILYIYILQENMYILYIYIPSINELTIIALKAFPSPLIRNLLIGSPRITSINLTEPGTPVVCLRKKGSYQGQKIT
jgi:hypothetical protein